MEAETSAKVMKFVSYGRWTTFKAGDRGDIQTRIAIIEYTDGTFSCMAEQCPPGWFLDYQAAQCHATLMERGLKESVEALGHGVN